MLRKFCLSLSVGKQLAVDATLVSAHHGDGTHLKKTDEKDWGALKLPRKKEDRYPQLCGAIGRARLVVSAGESGPRQSEVRSEDSPSERAWYRRWSGLWASCAAKAFPTSLLKKRGDPGGARSARGIPVRCDAEACSGDCGTDFLIATREKKSQVVEQKNEKECNESSVGRRVASLIFHVLKISDVQGRTTEFHELFNVEPAKRQHQATSSGNMGTKLLCRLARKNTKQFFTVPSAVEEIVPGAKGPVSVSVSGDSSKRFEELQRVQRRGPGHSEARQSRIN